MIIEDEGAMNLGFDHEHEVNFFISISHGEIPELHDFLQTHNREIGIEQLTLKYKKI
jgi:hypothetical protein